MGLDSSSREGLVTVVADGDFDFADVRDTFSKIYSSHEGSELLLILIDDRSSSFSPDTPSLRRMVDLWTGLSAAPPPLMKLRDYTPKDHAACIAVFDTNVGKYFVDVERNEFTEFLHELPGPYLVLETESGEVVGCGGYALQKDGTTVDLCWGMIARTRHGEGLGRLLTEERLRRIEKEPAVLSVLLGTSQHTAGFYERLGFVMEAHIPDGYGPGIDRCDMRFRLDQG